MTSNPKSEGRFLPPGGRFWLLISVAAYVLLLVSIRPTDYVDSFNYARHMVDHQHHLLPVETDPYWDFGHVLWRQTGSIVWSVFRGPLSAPFHNEVFSAASALIVLSVAGGFAGTILLYMLLAQLSRKAWVAGIVTIGFLGTHAALDYVLTGMAYTAGIAMQIGGLYVLYRSIQAHRFSAKRGLAAGFLLGASVCLWFPYVLSMGGLLCFALIWSDDEKPVDFRGRLPFLLAVAGGLAVTCLVAYAWVMARAHIASVEAAVRWVTRSRYDIAPSRGYLRTISGIARAFYALGEDAVVWKRLLFGSAGSHVTLLEIARTGIWKLAAVYGVIGLVVLRLWKSVQGRKLLICLTLNTVPVAIFAAFLFDPSPSVRFLEVFPLLFVAFAWIVSQERPGVLGRVILPLFFASMLAVNCVAMSRFGGNRELQASINRLQSVNQRAGPNDRILLLTIREPANVFAEARPFHPESRNFWLFDIVIKQGTNRIVFWRHDLAERVFATWKKGGRVWASLRLVAAAPDPGWNWVEGDDRRVKWADIPGFFRQLELGPGFGGNDGFAELVHSEQNERLLRAAMGDQ